MAHIYNNLVHENCPVDFQAVVNPIFELIRVVFINPEDCGYADSAMCASNIVQSWISIHQHLLPVAPPSRLREFIKCFNLNCKL